MIIRFLHARRVFPALGGALAFLLAGCGLETPGDAAPPADDEAYYLPFAAGTTHWVGQGNFGAFNLSSHQDQYAIDFVMPLDTAVLAARAGEVVVVRDDCPNVNCPFTPDTCCGNYVRVRHADGTVALYLHLRQGGSCVQVGQHVQRGDAIARSGNTGRSLAPHLHFSVFAAPNRPGGGSHGPSKNRSIEVRFADIGNRVPVWLVPFRSGNSLGVDSCAPGSEAVTK